MLTPRRWLVGTCQPRTSPDGKFRAQEVVLRISKGASFTWSLTTLMPGLHCSSLYNIHKGLIGNSPCYATELRTWRIT